MNRPTHLHWTPALEPLELIAEDGVDIPLLIQILGLSWRWCA